MSNAEGSAYSPGVANPKGTLMTNPTRAALYLRLSETSDNSTSIARQEKDLRDMAEREDWEVTHVLTDDGISGRKAREKAEEALRLLGSGVVDVLAVWKLDRFGRRGPRDLIAIEDAIERNPSGRFLTWDRQIDTRSETWDMVGGLMASIARRESANIGARVRSSREYLATEAHRYGGGGRPYGYRSAPHPSGEGQTLEPDPVEAAIVREIAERLIADESLVSIARDLNRRGIPTRRKTRRGPDGERVPTRWHTSTVADLIRTPGIVGRIIHRGEVVLDDAGKPVQAWVPVLDVATWRRAVEAIEPRATTKAPRDRRRPVRMLSGLVHCGSCGRAMPLRGFRGKAIYACNSKANAFECERGVTILAERVEAIVEESFLGMVGDWPLVIVEESADAEAVEALALADEALDSVLARLRDVDDEDEEAALLTRRRKIRASIPDLRLAATAKSPRKVETGLTYAQEWALRDAPGHHAMISRAIDHVVIHPAIGRSTRVDPRRVEIAWTPDKPEMHL